MGGINSLGTNSKIGMSLSILGVYENYTSSRAQAEAQANQIIQQGKNAIKSMNYAFQNYETDRRNAFEQATAQLSNIRLQARGLEASVENATGERMGDSKTAHLLNRSTQAEGLRATTQTKMNYVKRADEIDQNKEQTYLSTKSYLDNLQTPKIPNLLAGIWNGAGQVLQAYNSYKTMQNTRDSRIGAPQSGYFNDFSWNPAIRNTGIFANNAYEGFTANPFQLGVLQATSNDPTALNYNRGRYYWSDGNNMKWNNTI